MHKPSILRKIEEYDICELVFTPKKDGDPSGAEASRADAAANAKDGEWRDYPSTVLGHSTRPSRREGPLAVDEHVMLENISKATDIYEAALEALVELSA